MPNDVTYVADTTTLNGQPVGQPDGGVFPLIDRIDISSADLPPPGAAEGVLSPGESAVVQFDMQVNPGVPTGTLIVNQATVYTDELPNLLTDGDGNPSTGPEPTVVVELTATDSGGLSFSQRTMRKRRTPWARKCPGGSDPAGGRCRRTTQPISGNCRVSISPVSPRGT